MLFTSICSVQCFNNIIKMLNLISILCCTFRINIRNGMAFSYSTSFKSVNTTIRYVYNIILKLNYFIWTEVCWCIRFLPIFVFLMVSHSIRCFFCVLLLFFFVLNESQIEQTILNIKWKWFTCFRVLDWWLVYLRNRVLYD